jgi:hypothetical protein
MKNYLQFSIDAYEDEVQMKVQPIYGSTSSKLDLKVSNQDYIPTKGDKLYFLPGVNIPRVKLKDLTMEHGIKSVRNIDDATHIFAGHGTVHKICDHTWLYRLKTDVFRQVYETIKDKMDDYYKENVDSALEFYTEDYVFMDYSSSSEIRNEPIFEEARKIEGLVKSLNNSKSFYGVEDEYASYFPSILNHEILSESTLLQYINGPDAVVIDETMFQQLNTMFNSSDNDNHILAMEIMANSNYLDSLLYLEILFKEHSYAMGNCHTKNHVNFKSLLGYLGKDKGRMGTNIDDIMKSLIDKGVLTTDKIDVILKRYSTEIENNGGTDFFKVKTITVHESTLALLNKNYTFQQIPDYVVEEEIEEPIELHGDLDDLNSGVAGVASGVERVENDIEISDDDIETALLRVERNELKTELIELEQSENVSESELNEPQGTLEEESNNNQTEEKDGDDFEWF